MHVCVGEKKTFNLLAFLPIALATEGDLDLPFSSDGKMFVIDNRPISR